MISGGRVKVQKKWKCDLDCCCGGGEYDERPTNE